MIVRNIMSVTLLVIIGTTFVISAAKQHLELKQEVIQRKAHEQNSLDDLGVLSNFTVVRRFLSPVLIEKYIYFVKDKSHVSENNNKSRNVIEKLKTSVTLRDNILHIFSYLLYGCDTGFTEDQYTSLQILYEFLKKKTVYMYNLLPNLIRLSTADKNRQTAIILLLLIKNLPPYLQCTARFFANEIEQEKLDLNRLLSHTTSETFNYLANINLDTLRNKLNIVDDEMKGSDEYSDITQKALGPIFVKLLYNLHEQNLPLSQELFGLILINLPNPNDDPVLEENIRYLYDVTKNNVINHRNWDLIGGNPVKGDVYTLVFSVLSKILISDVGIVVKNAAVYVYHHLRLVMTPTYDNPNIMYLRRLIKQDIDIEMLLSAIVPQEFGSEAIRLKDHLVMYFRHNYRNGELDVILNGFNKFAYRDPLDLLIAFLTRIVNRISSYPTTNLETIQQSVTALLSTLIVKKSTRTFTPFVSPEIDVLILIDSLKIPDIEPAFQSTIDLIKLELIVQPQLSVLVSTLLPTEKYNCLTPVQCLMHTFHNIQRIQDTLPMSLIVNIQTITYILKTRLTQLQYYFISQFSVPSFDTNIAHFNVNNHEIRQKERVQKRSNSLNYKWNLINYYNVMPGVQVGSETTRRQTTESNQQTTKHMKNITHGQSAKTRVESSTIKNQAQVTEHMKSNKPSREISSDKHLISSSTPTSIYYDLTGIIDKPLQTSEKEQPRQSISVTPPNVTEDQESDASSLNTEEEISSQSNTSEEDESQTYPFEETAKDNERSYEEQYEELYQEPTQEITTKKLPTKLVKTIRKTANRKKASPQKSTNTEKSIVTSTVLPNIESNKIEKEKSNVENLHIKEEEISSQQNINEEIESQTLKETNEDNKEPHEELTERTTIKKPTRLVKAIRKITKRKKKLPQKTTSTERTIATTTVLPNIELNNTEKHESNIGILYQKEEEILSQSNTSKENEGQTLEEVNKDVTTRKFTHEELTERTTTMKPTRLVKTIRKITKRKTKLPQKRTNTERTIATTTVLPNIESNNTEKHESNIGILHLKEEEILSQSNTSKENEDQTLEEVNKDVTTRKSTQSVKNTRNYTKEETSIPEETTNDVPESVTTKVLPPSIELNESIKIQISDNGVPIITPDDRNKTVPGLVLPQITELLKPANINDFFSNNDTPIVTQILQPLSVIFGKSYIKKILQDVDVNVYPTNIALLLALLKKATTYQEVTTNTNLTDLIQKYISIIKHVSPTILLPVVVLSKKLESEVVYSTFNLTHSEISERPPFEALPDTITIPLVNPKLWLQSINPSDPYADLLPTLEEESVYAKIIQPLKNILTSKSIARLLGADFQPLAYPNRGTLLITLLHKLRETKIIQSDSKLKSLINMYIYAIVIPSINIQVSKNDFMKMSESTGQWQPELTSLIVALPTAKNIVETAMIQQIEEFLADPTVLEKLHIDIPPSMTSRGELLHKIIQSVLSDKTQLKNHVVKAFRYYKDKVDFVDMGALPIMWMWVETYEVKAEINLGSMIQQTVDFNQLSYKEKVAYNDVITYLAENPNILQDNEDFEFHKYKTQGQFIQGLFKHILKKKINDKIKQDIQMLLSRVMLTGPGAIAIPNLSGF